MGQRTEKAFDEYTFAELRQFHKQAAKELTEAKGQVAGAGSGSGSGAGAGRQEELQAMLM